MPGGRSVSIIDAIIQAGSAAAGDRVPGVALQ
jgi:hypothetical protein